MKSEKNNYFVINDDGLTVGVLLQVPEDFFIFVSFDNDYPIESVFETIRTEYGLNSFSLAVASHVATYNYGDNGIIEEF